MLIAKYLPPDDLVRARSVKRSWYAVLTRPEACLTFLRHHFPHCREMRLATAIDDLCAVPSLAAADAAGGNFELRLAIELEQQTLLTAKGVPARDWCRVFTRVTARYHGLRTARPRRIDTLLLAPSEHEADDAFGLGANTPFRFQGVAPWDFYLHHLTQKAPLQYPDAQWCYGDEDGLLVYPTVAYGGGLNGEEISDIKWNHRYPYRLRDLETGVEMVVPFDVEDKIIRRVRLADAVLLFEWAEVVLELSTSGPPRPQRHFMSAFDVVRRRSPPTAAAAAATSGPGALWYWQLHARRPLAIFALGLPIHPNHRFFSAHTNTHYALFTWSVSAGDPAMLFEALRVWATATGTEASPLVFGAHGSELDAWGLRQTTMPRLRGLALDEANVYLLEEQHPWARGPQGSSFHLHRHREHSVRTIGIPLSPPGPDPPMAGPPAFGPVWEQRCPAKGGIDMAFCQQPPEVIGVAASAPPLASALRPRLQPDLDAVRAGDFAWRVAGQPQTLSSRGPSGAYPFDRAWPGEAACWRHRDFPYLVVSEAVDRAAGTRAVARHCIMMGVVSEHVGPTVSMVAPAGPVRLARPAGGARPAGRQGSAEEAEEDRRLTKMVESWDQVAAAPGREALFGDGMWERLLGKGYIGGDERWIVGEDNHGRVTIVRF